MRWLTETIGNTLVALFVLFDFSLSLSLPLFIGNSTITTTREEGTDAQIIVHCCSLYRWTASVATTNGKCYRRRKKKQQRDAKFTMKKRQKKNDEKERKRDTAEEGEERREKK